MTLSVVAFAPEFDDEWDEFCRTSVNATFLHTRRFLSYHGTRFEDFSVLLYDQKYLIGILPAARNPGNSAFVVSHPGITYGGFVHSGRLVGEKTIEAFQSVVNFYRSRGVTRFYYKSVPYIYHRVPAQDDSYALFRINAFRERCEISCAIDLRSRPQVSERRQRSLRKAKSAATLSSSIDHLDALWTILVETLASRHGVRPVHSHAEIKELIRRFPEEIIVRVALVAGRAVAGAIVFVTSRVWHAQYIASNNEGRRFSALDLVFDAAIAEATTTGASYFDFGTSNEQDGRSLNTGLYAYKSEFGGGGVAHDTYRLDLI